MVDLDLYPGVAVDFTPDRLRAQNLKARLWFTFKRQAWVVVFKAPPYKPTVRVFNLEWVRVSQCPDEPPAMPKFTKTETPWISPLNVKHPFQLQSNRRAAKAAEVHSATLRRGLVGQNPKS